ncbi:hypothetical protein KIL84_005696 [Mauremys mutica]|uniref:Uncharacterized protein n=1 Tax=Mauremys mutica TaxID=74926 RepID=A0A9D3XHD0_9SAUR|nr:hypothetical protein KIL84_005696 [Mauremys mutica]
MVWIKQSDSYRAAGVSDTSERSPVNLPGQFLAAFLVSTCANRHKNPASEGRKAEELLHGTVSISVTDQVLANGGCRVLSTSEDEMVSEQPLEAQSAWN